MARRTSYRPIADYALIGNTHSAALIAKDGSIDWCCLPHLDSGAVFCRLLDAERGGFFRVGPADGGACVSRRYVDETAVLETEFATPDGSACITDFMHTTRIAHSRLGTDDLRCHRLLRRIEGRSGVIELELAFRPTFDFARQPASLLPTPQGVLARSGSERLELRLTPARPIVLDGDTATARLRVRAGERVWVVVSHGDEKRGAVALEGADPQAILDETCRHWREWSTTCTYDGPFAAEVRLSARVLKLLTFGPTGALVAAPTTSLPEELGGVRNWDYRFCWLRDAALVLRALMSIGQHEAAMDFFVWLENLCETECDGMQIMYRLDGSRQLPEVELHHLSGYRGSAPVRVGNAAATQLQLDVYGHVLDAARVCLEGMEPPIRPGLSRVLAHLADEAARRWHEPDHGLWEVRREPRHFLSSKLMCWVALDRALRLAAEGKLDGDVDRWRRECEAVRRAILERGYDRATGCFTQVLDEPGVDASALLLPLVGFLPARDERVRSTVEHIRNTLMADGLVYRYRDDDGVPGGEGTFVMCTCWLADNLALQGRVGEATALVERVLSFSSDLGLLAEEIDADSGLLLGNYPQGFTHLAVIHSALTIGRALRGEVGA